MFHFDVWLFNFFKQPFEKFGGLPDTLTMTDKKSSQKPTSKTISPDSREALIGAALTVFAQKGYEGATVKDLADAAGVNVSLVSYHFGGKENLYRACVSTFGEERAVATERILRDASSKAEFVLRLKLFAEDMVDFFEGNQNACKIIDRGMDALDPVLLEVFKNVFFRVFSSLHNFVESGQRSGFVRKDCDTEITASLMFGSLKHLNSSQEIARFLGRRTLDEPVYRNQCIEHWVRTHTEGIFAP